MSITSFLKKPGEVPRPSTPRPLPTYSGSGVERMDGKLSVVDPARRLVAMWAGGCVVSIWSYDERCALLEEVGILRCAIPAERLDGPRAATDWLRARLAEWRR